MTVGTPITLRLPPRMWGRFLRLGGSVLLFLIAGGAAGAWLTTSGWMRLPWQAMPPAAQSSVDAEDHAHNHEHAGHGHDHAAHDEGTSIELSPEAQKNIGLNVAAVELRPFERTVTVPAIVVERPGRSRVVITAPLTGVITKIYPLLGEAIAAGQPLFEMRLTHEELVQAQSDFLRSLEELDVVNRELARLDAIAAEGAIAGKTVLERKYEQQKLEAAIRAQEQALLLHGLNGPQVKAIRDDRRLLGAVTVFAPEPSKTMSTAAESPCLLQVQELNVEQGKHVTAGDQLAVLADHCELYLEGKAFEQDVRRLNEAAKQEWAVQASLDVGDGEMETISGLKILLLGNRIDPDSRTLPFYTTLENEVVRDEKSADGRRFLSWRFKPGQRAEVQIPVETWQDRVVLPAAAAVQEGPETYVFLQNGDHFDRRPVHVEYRDQQWVVLAEKNELWPGDMVAMSGAQQLQLALKNKAGGGADPHAGHNH